MARAYNTGGELQHRPPCEFGVKVVVVVSVEGRILSARSSLVSERPSLERTRRQAVIESDAVHLSEKKWLARVPIERATHSGNC